MQDGTSWKPQAKGDLCSAALPSPAEIETQLRSILDSAIFRSSARHSRFLTFVVRKVLAGEADSIKEYPIGLEVFDRPPDFDPAADPVVRSEARRLRSRLADYYAELGRLDPIRIELPKGTYVPVFRYNTTVSSSEESASKSLVAAAERESSGSNRGNTFVAFLLIGAVGFSIVTAAGLYLLSRKKPRSLASPTAASSVNVRRSIAVLGFENLSRRPDKDWLASAFSEMLTTEVGANGKLRTIPGEAVARARTDLQLSPHNGLSKDTLSRVERNLNADLVVSGAYTILSAPANKSDQVRFEFCLQDAKTGETIASRAMTGSVADLFSLISLAGSSLRQDLNVEPVSSAEAAAARAAAPSNQEAAKLYAEGLTKLRNFDAIGALPLLRQSAAIDPSFPSVHLALADAYASLGEEVSEQSSVEKAYQASSHLSREEQLHIKARYEETSNHLDGAIATYRALLTFYPDNLDYGLGLVRVENKLGQRTDALRTLEQLRTLPAPLSADPQIDMEEAQVRGAMSDFQQAAVFAARAADKAKARGARLLYAQARLRQAGMLMSMGQVELAQPLNEEARNLCAQLGDLACVATVYRRIGNLKVHTDPQGAELAFRQGLKIAEQIGSKKEEGEDLNGLAAVVFYEGHYTESGSIHRQLLANARERHTAFSIQMFLNNVGEDEIELGHLAEAKKMEEEAVAVSRQSSQKVGIGYGRMDTARILLLEGDLAGAEKDYREAMDAFRGMDVREVAIIRAGLAAIARDRDQFAAASDAYKQALGRFSSEGTEDDGDLADIRLGFARLCIDQGLSEKGVLLARQAVGTFNRTKRPIDEGRAHAVLAEALLANGDFDGAAAEANHASALLSKGEARVAKLFVCVAAARVTASIDQTRNPQNLPLDLSRLELVASQARSLNLLSLAMEARLAKSTLEVSTNRPESLTQLRRLQSEAESRGLLLLAKKAEAAAANAPVDSASNGPALAGTKQFRH